MWWKKTAVQQTAILNGRLEALHQRVAILEAEMESLSDLTSAIIVRLDRMQGITREREDGSV